MSLLARPVIDCSPKNPMVQSIEVIRWQASTKGSVQSKRGDDAWVEDTLFEESLVEERLAEEVPVALVYNGISHAVMMALPDNLEMLAKGFSLSEGIIHSTQELYSIDIFPQSNGIEVRMTISAERMQYLKSHRRSLTGRTGCGLCGTESLDQAIRAVQSLTKQPLPDSSAVQAAVMALTEHQPVQSLTGACHGAAWCDASGQIVRLFEDIGRHNALDKLIGYLYTEGMNTSNGFALVSSRASYEMVHKALATGISTLVAVSAPTTLAVDIARSGNINLIGFARPGRHVVYSQ